MFVLAGTTERTNVTIVGTVNDEVVNIGEVRIASARLVLPHNRSDGDHSVDVEVVVKRDGCIVRVIWKGIKESSDSNCLPTPSMTNQPYATHVDFPDKRVGYVLVICHGTVLSNFPP